MLKKDSCFDFQKSSILVKRFNRSGCTRCLAQYKLTNNGKGKSLTAAALDVVKTLKEQQIFLRYVHETKKEIEPGVTP